MLDVAVLIHLRRHHHHQHNNNNNIFSNLKHEAFRNTNALLSLIVEFLQRLIMQRTNICSCSVLNQETAGHIELANILPALQLSHTEQKPYHILPV
jgi:hypothetical protein